MQIARTMASFGAKALKAAMQHAPVDDSIKDLVVQEQTWCKTRPTQMPARICRRDLQWE